MSENTRKTHPAASVDFVPGSTDDEDLNQRKPHAHMKKTNAKEATKGLTWPFALMCCGRHLSHKIL